AGSSHSVKPGMRQTFSRRGVSALTSNVTTTACQLITKSLRPSGENCNGAFFGVLVTPSFLGSISRDAQPLHQLSRPSTGPTLQDPPAFASRKPFGERAKQLEKHCALRGCFSKRLPDRW